MRKKKYTCIIFKWKKNEFVKILYFLNSIHPPPKNLSDKPLVQ